MKKIVSALFIVFLVLLSVSCTSKFSKYTNIKWTTEDDFLTLYVEGQSSYFAFGDMIVDGEKIEVVAFLIWYESKIEIYSYDDIVNKDTDINYYNSSLVRFSMGGINAFSTTKLNVQTDENYSDYEELDNLSFIMTRTDLSEDELDAKNFIDMNWNNQDIGLSFDSDFLSYYTSICYGELEDGEEELNIVFYFLEDQYFEIRQENEEETLLLYGTYETHEESMTLSVLEDYIYDNAYLEIEMIHIQKY